MCKGCGYCCSNILPMSAREIDVIKAYIERHDIKEQKNVVAQGKEDCPFLDLRRKEKRCRIYEVRPLICRDYDCGRYERHEPPARELYAEMRLPVIVSEVFYGTDK